MRLDGKTAVVAGGLGLIGKQISRAFTQVGARTIIIGRNAKEGKALVKELGPGATYVNFDLSKLEKVDGVLAGLYKKYGGIDIVVNAAYDKTADWEDGIEAIKLSSWRKNVDMQLNSYSWISRRACLMMRTTGGSVINIASIYGMLGNDFTIYEGTTMSPPMAYAAIKGGVINVTRYLASYFGKYNVRVNVVCPGGVFNGQNKKFVLNYSKKTPLKRMARPEEVAGAVLFLASDLSAYITGAIIPVDGGWSAI